MEDQKRDFVSRLVKEFTQFLEIPAPSAETFDVGYLFPSDVPDKVTDFFRQRELSINGEKIVSFKAFRKVFKEKVVEPKLPTKADFLPEAIKKFPDVPLDHLNEIERQRNHWINQQIGLATTKHESDLTAFKAREEKRESFIEEYEDSPDGYVQFLKDHYPSIANFFERKIPVYINEDNRRKHTYIVGQSGSGKSELLKYLAHAYASNKAPSSAVVIIDPHGDLAVDVAKLANRYGKDKLVYFDVGLSYEYSPVVNLFHSEKRDAIKNIQERMRFISWQTQAIIGGFKAMMKTEFTKQMENLLKHCLCTLLQIPNSNISDLKEFTQIDKNNRQNRFIEEGLNSIFETQRPFFKNEFLSDSWKATRTGVANRMLGLNSDPVFLNCLTGQNTIDLEEAINNRSVIILNLSQGELGVEVAQAFGALILAQILSIGFSRHNLPESERIPVHIFVDECQNFISDSVTKTLTEARKYKLHLTLAQQTVGQDMDTAVEETVLANTNTKIAGNAGYKSFNKLARECNIELDDLHALKKWQFYLSAGDNIRLPIRTYDDLIVEGACMSDEEWEDVKKQQLKKYYRRLGSGKSKIPTTPLQKNTPPHTVKRINEYGGLE